MVAARSRRALACPWRADDSRSRRTRRQDQKQIRFIGENQPANALIGSVSAQDAVNLGAVNFLNGSQEHDFLVRFRGFNGGGSDKVPAVEGVGPPLPGPAVLTAMALGLVMLRRRVRPA